MSGLRKPKEYDWKDSNMALCGTDTDRKVKKESAMTEPAWQGAGGEVGIQIWRIVKFKVEHWNKEQHGEFFTGDSYIILNTYKEPEGDELKYDVHFWIGKYSTQDEYATAAYKTVELDTFLDDKPIQHREVQGHEGSMFKGYFDVITLMKGGADTGFRRVLPEAYIPRLFHIEKQADKKITCTQKATKKGNLESDDVFIIDSGLKIWQFNGRTASADEKFKGAAMVKNMKEGRKGCTTDVIEEKSTSPNHPALKILQDGKSKSAGEKAAEPTMAPEMKCVSDEDGSLDCDDVEGYGRDKLKSGDVFIINTGTHVFCWVGKDANVDERKNAMAYACTYLHGTVCPWLPITVVAEGKENEFFLSSVPN
jgi:gelsolin